MVKETLLCRNGEKMNKGIIPYCILSLLGVFFSAVSQVMLKKAAMKKYDTSLKEYLNPTVMGAYMLFAGTTFLSIFAYKKIPLSIGPMLEATGYIYITYFGSKFFNEKLNKKKCLAVCCIVIGIVIYSLG